MSRESDWIRKRQEELEAAMREISEILTAPYSEPVNTANQVERFLRSIILKHHAVSEIAFRVLPEEERKP